LLLVVLAGSKAELNVILPSWHESIDDNDSLVYLLVDTDESSRPGRTVDGDGETSGQSICD
jgi:hypothetical protein